MADYIISGSAVSTGSFGRLESVDGIAIGPNSTNKLVPTRKFYVSTATHNTFTINAGSGDATLQLTKGDSESYNIQHANSGLEFIYTANGSSFPRWMFTSNALNTLFEQLSLQNVMLEGIVLKPNMVISGIKCDVKARIEKVED